MEGHSSKIFVRREPAFKFFTHPITLPLRTRLRNCANPLFSDPNRTRRQRSKGVSKRHTTEPSNKCRDSVMVETMRSAKVPCGGLYGTTVICKRVTGGLEQGGAPRAESNYNAENCPRRTSIVREFHCVPIALPVQFPLLALATIS